MATQTIADIDAALKGLGYENLQVANCLIMCRPKTVEEAKRWLTDNAASSKEQIAGQLVPKHWNSGVDWVWASSDTPFEIGEVVILQRSDGSLKFGLLQSKDDPQPGVHTIIVAYGEETNSVKAVPANTVGKLTLEGAPPPPPPPPRGPRL